MNNDYTRRAASRGRKNPVFIIIPIIALIALSASIIFFRNPFMPHVIDAKADTETLEELYSESRPYAKVKNIDLEFTGYYSVKGEEVISYCFIGTIGGERCFIELEADTVAEYVETVSDGIKDASFSGLIRTDSEVIYVAAEEEGMTEEVYIEQFKVSRYIIDEPRTDRGTIMILYVFAFVLILLVFVLYLIARFGKVGRKEKNA